MTTVSDRPGRAAAAATGATPATHAAGTTGARRVPPTAEGADISGSPRRWWVLAVLIVSLLVVVLDNTILNVALPTIQHALHASQSAQEWIVDSYTLVFAGLLFTFGVMGDRFGRKRALMVGMTIFGLGSVLSAFAPSAGVLIATRALMGAGGAAVLPCTLSIISNVFDARERGRAIGIWAGCTGMAVAIGPITGGALLAHFWWGSVFLVNIPVVVVGLVLTRLVVPESRNPQPQRFDPPGVLLSVASLVLLVYGIIKGGADNRWTTASVLVPLVAGLVLLVVFVLVERRSDHPALDIALFRNPAFSAASVAITAAFFALFGATFYLTFYLQFDRGYTPLQSGIRLLPVAISIVVLAPRSAGLARRYGPRLVCTTGLLLVSLAFLTYQLLDTGTSIWVLEGLLLLQGTGMANVMAPATESIMSTLPRERAGAGSAVNNTVRQVGGALGVAILGSLLSAVYRSSVETHLQALPAAVRQDAGESLGGTLAALGPPQGELYRSVLPHAKASFVHAMHVTSLGSALVAFAGALVVLRWLPGRPRQVGRHAAGPVRADA